MPAPDLQTIAPTTLAAHAALDIAFPPLPAHGVLCVGVTLASALLATLKAACLPLTSPAEQERAARFLHAKDALRHLYGRALLRSAAQTYGVIEGGNDGIREVQEFELNRWGKPLLPGATLSANISHSGMQVWLALARDCEVGIDIESAQAPVDFLDIAAAFHAQEQQTIRAAQDAPLAMMRCWSRKEAVAKAVGHGLSLPLDAYAVDTGVAATGWLRQAPPDTQLADWHCVDLPQIAQHVGAVAACGDCRSIRVWQLQIAA